MKEKIDSQIVRHFKNKVRYLHKLLKVFIPALKRGHCFDCLSRLYGTSGWHEMRIKLDRDDDLVDNISPNLEKKAIQLCSLLESRSFNITVDECYECLHVLYPTGNTYEGGIFEANNSLTKAECNY